MLAAYEANPSSTTASAPNDPAETAFVPSPHHHAASSATCCNSLLLDSNDAMSAASHDAQDSTATAASTSPADANKAMFRVKLYELNGESTWDDKGTGFCEIVFVEVLSGARSLTASDALV